jgi:hypothetical protein
MVQDDPVTPEVGLPAEILVDGVAVFGFQPAFIGFEAEAGDHVGRIFRKFRPSKNGEAI